MKKILQVKISRGDTHYIAEFIDVPIVTQAKSLDDLIVNIKEALCLYIEDEDLTQYEIDTRPSLLSNFEIQYA